MRLDLLVQILLAIAALGGVAVAASFLPAFPKLSEAAHRWIVGVGGAVCIGCVIAAWLWASRPATGAEEPLVPVAAQPEVGDAPVANNVPQPKTPAIAEPDQTAAVPQPNQEGAPPAPEPAAKAEATRPYTLSAEDKRRLVDLVMPLRASLPTIVINRSIVPGGDAIMMQLVEVFGRDGFKVVTGFQDVVGPAQTGLVVCVPDLRRVPPEATKLQRALAEIGFNAPIAMLPPQATQNPVVIFAGPPPL